MEKPPHQPSPGTHVQAQFLDKSRNDFNQLANSYEKSHEKADKKYSMLTTLLDIIKPLAGKTVVDVGCGDGFFTRPLAKEAKRVYGIDTSTEQIRKANTQPASNVAYQHADMRTYKYPSCDIITAPFVLNYCASQDELAQLFSKFQNGLKDNGLLVGIVDMPQTLLHDARKFGARKKVLANDLSSSAPLEIELYANELPLMTLRGFYHPQSVFESALNCAGFSQIQWMKPLVSDEGMRTYGEAFWQEYLKSCDVAYFVAHK